MKYVVAGTIFCLCSSLLSASGASPVPERFHARIGGFLGYTYEVELKGDYVEYGKFAGGKEALHAHARPSMDQWKAFRIELDTIGVWQWRAQYSNPGVLDGTQWSLDLRYPDRTIKAQGSNDYPGARPDSTARPSGSEIFTRYLNAVQRLLGGKPFE